MYRFTHRLFLLLAAIVVFTTIAFAQPEAKPKNIIFLIGDGMGLNLVTASVLTLENDSFKEFQSVGLVVTCSADKLITDSAAGATALATGHRTNNGMISVDPSGKTLSTIFEFAKQKGLSTGLVVACSITNATPACFYAHVSSRSNNFEIAEQFVHSGVDVTIGGGTNYFLPEELGGEREDQKNLVEMLKVNSYSFYSSYDELNKSNSERIISILDKDLIPKASERNYTLGDLTKIALNKLSKNSSGFILMVEGSQIDKAGHANDEDFYISEQKDFNYAVQEALKFAREDKNTLVIVTADHDTGGYSIIGGDKEAKKLEGGWLTKGHSANMVGVFAYGPGHQFFSKVLENYEIGRKLIEFVNPQINW